MDSPSVRISAYLLSLDRRRDGIPPDPLRDWLDAEWIRQHPPLYDYLVRAVFAELINTDIAPLSDLSYATRLTEDREKRWALTALLEPILLNLNAPISMGTLVERSVTVGGIIASIVAELHRAGPVERKGPSHKWIRRYQPDCTMRPLPPNGFVLAIPAAGFISEPFYSVERGLRLLEQQFRFYESVSTKEAEEIARAIKESDLPRGLAWGDLEVDAASIAGINFEVRVQST